MIAIAALAAVILKYASAGTFIVFAAFTLGYYIMAYYGRIYQERAERAERALRPPARMRSNGRRAREAQARRQELGGYAALGLKPGSTEDEIKSGRTPTLRAETPSPSGG